MASVVADDTFRLTSRTGRIEDVEGIGRCHGNALMRRGGSNEFVPIVIAVGYEVCLRHGALENNTGVGLVPRKAESFVEQWVVGDYFFDFYSAGCGDDNFRLGIVDAGCQLPCGKSSEDHGVNGAEAGTCEHGDGRFRNHRHINDDPVAFYNTQASERSREKSYLVAQFAIGEFLDGVGHGAVVDEGCLVAAALVDVQVERVIAGVYLAADEPAIKGLTAGVEYLVPTFVPVNRFRDFTPKTGRIREGPIKSSLQRTFRHTIRPAGL